LIRPIDIDFARLRKLSRFVDEVLRRWPDAGPIDQAVSRPSTEAVLVAPEKTLRRYRQLALVHALWMDLTGQADIECTGQTISSLARDCLALALVVASQRIQADFGVLRDDHDKPIELSVLGLGKLGGDELNFNSDIDVVFAYRDRGRSDGRRRLDAAAYLKRLALELIGLLDAVTSDGRVWVVDTRLRPFGEAGALVWSIGAMEQYFVNEGRSWERYAWLKAAPAAGDTRTAEALLQTLQPFIFRRYLDYGIFESLRELHARIDANSHAEARRNDIKRGPGGIRELEFLVQSQQILRGGRDRTLRVAGFLPALRACSAHGLIKTETVHSLRQAYQFLRILENRLQAMTGRQTHELPRTDRDRQMLAQLMGAQDWGALAREIAVYRTCVRDHFSQQFADRPSDRPSQSPATALWPPGPATEQGLKDLGVTAAESIAGLLHGLARRVANRALSAEGRRRLERLMPELMAEVLRHPTPESGLKPLLDLIEQISQRSAYLALLHERPTTLERLVRVFRASSRLATWIVRSPQLIDDLLDPVHGLELPTAPPAEPEDPESTLNALGRWRQAGFLRTALAELDGRIDALEAAARLSRIAEITLARVLELSSENESDLAVIAYGNLGAGLAHFESDLDLVFLHHDGPAPVRTAQRLISFMQLPLPGGRLFEIDTRLRPNGRSGLLVSRLDRFADYQSTQAWTWEHQALIRARWVAGNERLKSAFDQVRAQVLAQRRDTRKVRHDLAQMRRRQLAERDESEVKRGMTDLQFIAECGLLSAAAGDSGLIALRRPDRQLARLGEIGWLESGQAEHLARCWRELLDFSHRQWLEDASSQELDRTLIEPVRAAWPTVFGAD